MTRTQLFNTIAFKPRRFTPGDTFFVVFASGAFLAGVALLLLPFRKVSGPSLVVIYSVLPPHIWSFVFLAMSVLPVFAVLHPTIPARKTVYCTFLPLGVAWTAGLAIPFVQRDTGSFWGPLIWGMLTAIGYVSYWLIPLDAPFYRRLRHDTLVHRVADVLGMGGYRRKGQSSSRVPSHLKGK